MGTKNRRTGGFFLCVLLLLVLAGCGGGKSSLREEAPVPVATGPRVAVAPMENWSNDISASGIIRSAFVGEITQKGWNVVPTEESDQALRETLGVSYGGQLASTTPEEVCRALKVEGVFYGEVREWNKTTTGVYNNVTVIASFKLYGKDGVRVWEGSDTKSKVIVPKGSGDIAAEIVVQAMGNLLLNPMTPYGEAVAKNIAGKLPGGLLEGRGGTMGSDNTIRGTGTPEERGVTR